MFLDEMFENGAFCRSQKSERQKVTQPASNPISPILLMNQYSHYYAVQVVLIYFPKQLTAFVFNAPLPIGADFAGATGAIAPAVKILRERRLAVTREVAPVNPCQRWSKMFIFYQTPNEYKSTINVFRLLLSLLLPSMIKLKSLQLEAEHLVECITHASRARAAPSCWVSSQRSETAPHGCLVATFCTYWPCEAVILTLYLLT